MNPPPIMPLIRSANMNLPTLMVAEHAPAGAMASMNRSGD
jgi:hypothetical protein